MQNSGGKRKKKEKRKVFFLLKSKNKYSQKPFKKTTAVWSECNEWIQENLRIKII